MAKADIYAWNSSLMHHVRLSIDAGILETHGNVEGLVADPLMRKSASLDEQHLSETIIAVDNDYKNDTVSQFIRFLAKNCNIDYLMFE